MKINPPKRFTQCQLRLEELIKKAGFEVILESAFPPYTVDCYCPEDHVAFEADGDGWHHKNRDKKRDEYLLGTHGLPIKRFKDKDLLKKSNESDIIKEILDFCEKYGSDIKVRKNMYLVEGKDE